MRLGWVALAVVLALAAENVLLLGLLGVYGHGSILDHHMRFAFIALVFGTCYAAVKAES